MTLEKQGNKIPDEPLSTGLESGQQTPELDNGEFSSYFHGKSPRVLVTTCQKPSKQSLSFATELSNIFIDSFLVKRKGHQGMGQVVKESIDHEYTDILVVGQRNNRPNSLTMIHLPSGPTAYMKLSSFRSGQTLGNRGVPTDHPPELVLNNFSTMLGTTVGRFLMALFPQIPDFKGRQVVTFHNQRDFIFFRRHRYIFEQDGEKVRLQELGPRFCLKLNALQQGTFEKDKEFIWTRKKGMNKRKDLFL